MGSPFPGPAGRVEQQHWQGAELPEGGADAWQGRGVPRRWGCGDRGGRGLSLQLSVSLATAMMPMGCWGMSTRRSFMSVPTYLLARCTALRTQSVQKM